MLLSQWCQISPMVISSVLTGKPFKQSTALNPVILVLRSLVRVTRSSCECLLF